MAENCVFCNIISRLMPSKIVYEDDFSTAFLDIAPRSRGMTIVASKHHYKDFDEDFELSQKIFNSALVVAEMIKQSLEPSYLNMSIIKSEGVQHFHIRLYPIYEGNPIPLAENMAIETNDIELEEIANKIRAVKIEIKKEEAEEKKNETREEPKDGSRSKEDVYWLRRSMEI